MSSKFLLGALALVMTGCTEDPGPVWLHVSDYMAIGREGLSISATNGGAVVTGGNLGFEGIVNFAELFDPVTRKWTPLPDIRGIMTSCGEVQRQDHQATVMPDGRVLITGGRYMMSVNSTGGCACAHNEFGCVSAYSNSFVVYDPDDMRSYACNKRTEHSANEECSASPFGFWSDGWSPVFKLPKRHALHTVNLLSNDPQKVDVLLIGGPGKSLEDTAEILRYENDSNASTACLLLPSDTSTEKVETIEGEFITGHTATPIEESFGRVVRMLVFGGVKALPGAPNPATTGEVITQAHAQILSISPSGGLSWAAVQGTVPPPRVGHVAMKLRDERILIAGGWDKDKNPLRDAWIFDGNGFERTPDMNHPHAFAGAVPVDDDVIVSGGFAAATSSSKLVERFDAESKSWRMLPSMHQERARHGMMQLPIGGTAFLVTGGIGNDDAVVRTGELLYMNDSCEQPSDCSPELTCEENHCVARE